MNKKKLLFLIFVGLVLDACLVVSIVRNYSKSGGVIRVIDGLDSRVKVIERGNRTSVITDTTVVNKLSREPIGMLETPTADSAELLASLMKLLRKGDEDSIDTAMIDANAMLDTTERCQFVSEILKLNDPERTWSAINMLVGYGNTEIIPVLRQAIDGKVDSDGMKSIMEAIGYLGNAEPLSKLQGEAIEEQKAEFQSKLTVENCQQLMEIIKAGLVYEDEDIRALSLEATSCLPVEMQAQVMWDILDSNDAALSKAVLEATSSSPNTDTLFMAFAALNSPDEEIRECAKFNINGFVNKEFENTEEAKAWWERNKASFDEELHMIDPESFEEK